MSSDVPSRNVVVPPRYDVIQRIVKLFSSHTLQECEEIFRYIKVYETKKAIKCFLDSSSEEEKTNMMVSIEDALMKKCDHKHHLIVVEDEYVRCKKCGWLG